MIGCRVLTDTEIQLIVHSLPDMRDKALFILSIYTGFRITESLSLKVSDVYQDNAVLERINVQRCYMKGKVKSRSILLHPDVRQVIKQHIEMNAMEPHWFLFKSRKGENGPINRQQAWRILRGAVKAHKMKGKVALHSTRKVFAEKMYKIFRKDLVKTSKALGHLNINSTVSYLSFQTEEMDEAVLELNINDNSSKKG